MRFVLSVLLLSLATAGCVGTIGDESAAEQTKPAPQPLCGPGPAPMRRLTRWEYNNTVHDLVGDVTAPASTFVPEAGQFGFDNSASGATLSDVVVEQFERAARDLATNAVSNLPALMGCDPSGAAEESCVASFIQGFGKRAFRRPLSSDEESRYQLFFASQRDLYGPTKAVELVVSAFLQSPHFLYRLELESESPEQVTPVTAFEMASRLSYFLWGTMPDDTLLAAAEEGRLETAEDVRREAERMLTDEKGARAVQNFFSQWGNLRSLPLIERDEAAFPQATRELMAKELELFVESAFSGEGTWQSVLTSNKSFLNEELAGFYGLDNVSGDEFREVELDPARHGGILTRGALMAILAHPDQTSPVLRGKFIREQLFCDPPPPPPCNADTALPEIDPNATTREQLEQKTGVEPCVACHSFLNPPGFAFDHFDQLGRWRDDDHGLPIDASGDLTLTDVDGSFTSHEQLVELISNSKDVKSCVVTHWFRYAHGRDKTPADQCSYDDLNEAFIASDGDLRQLLVDLTQTKSFLFRGGKS